MALFWLIYQKNTFHRNGIASGAFELFALKLRGLQNNFPRSPLRNWPRTRKEKLQGHVCENWVDSWYDEFQFMIKQIANFWYKADLLAAYWKHNKHCAFIKLLLTFITFMSNRKLLLTIPTTNAGNCKRTGFSSTSIFHLLNYSYKICFLFLSKPNTLISTDVWS